jgi:UDP-perosamine 4-acetyltransferase
MKTTPIILEKVNVSDDLYQITAVYAKSGTKVNKGDVLFSFETSKADIDYEAPEDGFFIHNLDTSTKIYPAKVIAFITSEIVSLDNLEISSITAHVISEQLVSAKAKLLIAEHAIDIAVFAKLTKVKEKDVLDYLKDNGKTKVDRICTNDLILIGGKGGCKMIIETIKSSNHFQIKGIIDTTMNKGETIMGIEVLGNSDEDLFELKKAGYNQLVLTFTSLNDLKIREAKYDFYKKEGFSFPNIIHNRATVEPSVKMGEGNIVLANSMLGSDVEIGTLNFINTGAVVCHDTTLDFNNHCAPNAVLAGRIKVGKNNIIGMCSTVFYDVIIGNNNVISNGVNIFNHIKDNTFQKQ